MQTWMIDFQGIPGSRRLRAAIEDRIAELAQRHEAIMTCHVVAKGPQAGKRSGLHEVDIRLTLADGRELDVGRSPRIDRRYEEIDFAINDTFRRARRRLKDHLSGRTGKKSSSSESGRPAPSPEAEAIVPVAASAPSEPAPADSQAEAPSPLPQTGSPIESSLVTVSGDTVVDQDALTREIEPAPLAAETAASDTEEPAPADSQAEAPSPLPETGSPIESSTVTVSGDTVVDQDALTPEIEPAPLAAETAARDAEEPARAEEPAAEPVAETASAKAATATAAATPAATAAAPEQAPNLSPLFMALAVGTALTAAATLNASAAWARIFRNAAEAKTKTNAEADVGKSSEAPPGVGGDRSAAGD